MRGNHSLAGLKITISQFPIHLGYPHLWKPPFRGASYGGPALNRSITWVHDMDEEIQSDWDLMW